MANTAVPRRSRLLGAVGLLSVRGQLAQGRHRRLGIPLHMDTAAKGVDSNRAGNDRQRR
jgi:hypothetical protein